MRRLLVAAVCAIAASGCTSFRGGPSFSAIEGGLDPMDATPVTYDFSANSGGFPYYYAASKAALNMFMRSLAGDPAAAGVTTVLLDPGWVSTDMGGRQAPLTPSESVASMLRVIDGLGPRDNGRFLDRHGRAKAW